MEERAVAKKHISYFDLLRLAAAYFVVLMHTAANGLRNDVAGHGGWYALAIMTSLTFCAVPLFFMMSGYLMTSSENSGDVGALFRKRLPKLAVPLAFWSVAHLIWNAYVSGDWSIGTFRQEITDALQTPVSTSFWFMYTLIGMYLISPVLCGGLKSLDRKGHGLVLGIIAVIEGFSAVRILFPAFYETYLVFDVVVGLEFFSRHLCSFILGWYLEKTEKKIPGGALIALALVLWGIISWGTVVRSSTAGTYVSDFQSQNSFFEVLLAASIFLLFRNIKFGDGSRLAAALARWSPATMVVYLAHALILRIFYYYGFVPLSASSVLLVGTGVYAVSLVLGRLLSLVPGLSFICCGAIRKRSKSEL